MIKLRQPFVGDYPISMGFGETYPGLYTLANTHKGIDYMTPENTPILAAADARVLRIGYEPKGYGNYVHLIHIDGSGTIYAHLNRHCTYNSAIVKKGDVIGYSGNTGNSTGPHLHFEFRLQADKQSTAKDPKLYMQSVVDFPQNQNQAQYAPIQTPVNLKPNTQRIDGGLCEVVCDEANIRDAENFMVKGCLRFGAKCVVSPDVVWYNNLPYHKIMDDYMLIAEYDGYGTDILKQIDSNK